MITGTIKNAVKLNVLTRKWEQKKNSGNVLSKQERNERANWTPEQRMLNQFKEEVEQNRAASKSTEIANKIMAGDTLTPEEEQYLAQKDPARLGEYRKIKAEKKAYEDKLKNCKTRDEVQRLKTSTMNGYLSELKKVENNPNIPLSEKCAKAQEILAKTRNIQAAETKFIESGGYAKLPTEAEEAIEKARETQEQNEELFEEIKGSEEQKDQDQAEEKKIPDNEPDDKAADSELSKKKHKIKETSDPAREIEDICHKYVQAEIKQEDHPAITAGGESSSPGRVNLTV